MNVSNAVEALVQLLGADRVSTDPADLTAHARDWSASALLAERTGEQGAAECVVRPADVEEVATILAWAAETGTPVVPFGGGSGVSEGIVATAGVVVDLGDMWRITDIDTKSRIVYVQAGATGPQVTAALAEQGYMLGHEPQSLAISTVGGWVATRACGQLSAGYGGIEDLICGMEAVLPGGRVVRAKVNPRRSAGPDVSSLMIGSEGTLGIVTEVALRISPIPEARSDRCLRFEHMADGVAATRKLAQSDLHPTVVRLYDAEDAALFLRDHPDAAAGPLLVMSFEGRGAKERAAEAVELMGGSEDDAGLVDHWWKHRNDAVDVYREIMAGQGLLGPHGVVDTMEVSGTWSGLRDLYHAMKEALGSEADLVGCHLSHVYPDGACLYFTMASFCDDDGAAAKRLAAWWETGMRTCLEAGGSISHHHGIGRLKAEWMDAEWQGWREVLRAVKNAIDPNGIMNPGALGL
ncbi:MAG: FAD-binding oxidoreductase [Actinomycetota bacterium]